MKPDFDELVGTDLGPEERERLRRAHDLLIAAGPPPELPPALADPTGPPKADVIPFWNRRRNAVIAVLAAALAALAFGIGYLTGHSKSANTFAAATIAIYTFSTCRSSRLRGASSRNCSRRCPRYAAAMECP